MTDCLCVHAEQPHRPHNNRLCFAFSQGAKHALNLTGPKFTLLCLAPLRAPSMFYTTGPVYVLAVLDVPGLQEGRPSLLVGDTGQHPVGPFWLFYRPQ